MPELIGLNIVRPEVGISYTPESPEAEVADRLAASLLALHALARNVSEMCAILGRECPAEVKYLVASDTWRFGL